MYGKLAISYTSTHWKYRMFSIKLVYNHRFLILVLLLLSDKVLNKVNLSKSIFI